MNILVFYGGDGGMGMLWVNGVVRLYLRINATEIPTFRDQKCEVVQLLVILVLKGGSGGFCLFMTF